MIEGIQIALKYFGEWQSHCAARQAHHDRDLREHSL